MHRPGREGDPSSLGTGATKEAEAALGTQRPPALAAGHLLFSPGKPRAAPAAPTSPPEAAHPRASITSSPGSALLPASAARPAGPGPGERPATPGAGTRGRLTPCGSLTK